MTINPLSSNLINLLSNDALTVNPSNNDEALDVNFADILSNSINAVTQTDKADKASAIQLLTGQSDDLPGLMLDMQKAELSLNLALQIRNKVIDAYNDIMKMQV